MVWVVSLATLGMVFDGYDLVAYGAAVPTFLKDPSQLGEVTPALAGTLGSRSPSGRHSRHTGRAHTGRRDATVALPGHASPKPLPRAAEDVLQCAHAIPLTVTPQP
jgi:hypothetical protein